MKGNVLIENIGTHHYFIYQTH